MKKKNFAFLLTAFVLFASCSKDPVDELEGVNNTSPAVEATTTEAMTEVATAEPGAVTEVYFAGQQIPVEQFNGDYIYQGDILLTEDMVSKEEVKLVYKKGETPPENKSVGRTYARWPDNTVYYAIDGSLSDKSRVYDAIAHWEANTNLKFVERSSESNYIYFVSGSGCSSYIGMIGGRQNITLGSSCTTGNTIHEIGHAVGLWHEQSRVDRENYITINYENIQSGREHNFKTYAEQGFDGAEFTNGLDFSSIMMYGSYSFSDNGRPTITRKDGSTFGIQRKGLSSGDKTGINNMYPYSTAGTTSTPVYVNGEMYTIDGLMVLRYHDVWYFSTKYGWKQVENRDNTWWYA